MAQKQILVTTTENIPNQKFEIIGEVFGLTTQSKNIVRNIGAGLKNLVGGEIKDYTQMMIESRDIAIDRLRNNAIEMGADAVVMMRFDSGAISTDMQSVAAYGTAVKFID
ncbi:heavy metal-binding domain-containing protein [Paucilactobacillus kaifaensis]|uniref:heavy metal-binding domain-containing protein n=1 Tax=Paucilactobacillus kaifaensis TaxID=2559921 RepID=UPI0010F8BB81|nr:heavy metal-binding domain-containing protein [Paucilactobacillus kaifaensis]